MGLDDLTEFTLNEYLGISEDNEGRVSRIDANISDPRYGDMTSYPDSLVVGDSLFPMLYIYYFGTNQNKAKVGNTKLFEDGLKDYFNQINSTKGKASSSNLSDISEASEFQNNIKKYYQMFVSAVNKNRNYLFMLSNTVSTLMGQYRTRLPKNRGSYYSNESRSKFDYFPVMNKGTGNLEAVMESLRILFENGMITATHSLGVRPLDLYSGGFADEQYEFSQTREMARVLGLPSRGIFTINNRPRTDYMFRTFSGIDIITLASLNTVVSRLEGLNQISWSIHRGKNPQRVLGKPTSPARTGGSRTIAGSMVFTLADHHPLLELLPGDYPVTNAGGLESEPEFWRPTMMPDQLPPFDLMVTMTNEYGYASIVSLYGVEVIDEGTVLGVDNLVTECVIQYTAVAMDPIMSVRLDENGDIDPYGLLQGGYSRMWKHREAVVAGTAYSDLEAAYESQYDATFSAMERRLRTARDKMRRQSAQ